MARKNRTPEENARREKIRKWLKPVLFTAGSALCKRYYITEPF